MQRRVELEHNERIEKQVKALPKIDLHRHLEGSIEPELLILTAKKYKIALPSLDVRELSPLIQITKKDKSLKSFLKKFEIIGKIFKSSLVISELTYQVVCHATLDNIVYLELRFSPVYMAAEYGLDLEEVTSSVLEGVRRAQSDTGVLVSLILIIERQLGPVAAKKVVKLASNFKKDVAAVDLANDELNFPPGPFADVFSQIKDLGLGITIHAGEAGDPENVAVSIKELHASRIGHGVLTQKKAELKSLVLETGTILEMCPTSNIHTGAVPALKEHPIKDFFSSGLRVTINTDDPAISKITLSGEILKVMQAFDFNLSEIRQMQMTSIEGAFLPVHAKERIKKEMEEGFSCV